MYIKKIILGIALLGLIGASVFAYYVYQTLFSPNTNFNTPTQVVYVPTGTTYTQLLDRIHPVVNDFYSFKKIAERKGYSKNINPGKYVFTKGMNSNQMVTVLQQQNTAVNVRVKAEENIKDLAGSIARQIEADSVALLAAFNAPKFLATHGFSLETALTMYIPNTYRLYWNTSATQFRDRMWKAYQHFWNRERMAKAKALGLETTEVILLASIVQHEMTKETQRIWVEDVTLHRGVQRSTIVAEEAATATALYYAFTCKDEVCTILIKRASQRSMIQPRSPKFKFEELPSAPKIMPTIATIDAILKYEPQK